MVAASPTSATSYVWKQNLLFMGTLVKYGHGVGVVVGTGKSTELGSMMDYMSEVSSYLLDYKTKNSSSDENG